MFVFENADAMREATPAIVMRAMKLAFRGSRYRNTMFTDATLLFRAAKGK
jgi:hypothetical protein